MSDKTATERLRELLDERVVEYRWDNGTATWYVNGVMYNAWGRDNERLTMSVCHLTPEQAVYATLGRRGYTYEQWRVISDALADAMESAHDKAVEHPDKAEPYWNLDEYVERVLKAAFGDDATLGCGTCHMVTDGHGWWECDTCGSTIDWDSCDENDPPSCNYCPNCGRKVVDA